MLQPSVGLFPFHSVHDANSCQVSPALRSCSPEVSNFLLFPILSLQSVLSLLFSAEQCIGSLSQQQPSNSNPYADVSHWHAIRMGYICSARMKEWIRTPEMSLCSALWPESPLGLKCNWKTFWFNSVCPKEWLVGHKTLWCAWLPLKGNEGTWKEFYGQTNSRTFHMVCSSSWILCPDKDAKKADQSRHLVPVGFIWN